MLSKKDSLIISILRSNAREKLTEISKKINIPVSTIYDRIKLHEGSIIKKHTTLLDFSKIGYAIRANIMLKVGKQHRETLKEYLKNNVVVNSLFKINNGFDFLIEVVLRDMKDLSDFIDSLEQRFSIDKMEEYLIIEEIKHESFMSNAK
ncbi:Lrp/AsnC family transcriptional regulator [Candidatus Woesearchaeota archaeon]|nr:MAG: Lrp/AsnC family transcriptional regulator [Candidatus Woesearchaeota archaeon]